MRTKGSVTILPLVFLALFFTILGFFKIRASKKPILPAYSAGLEAYRSGRYDKALDYFSQAITQSPNLVRQDPLLRFRIGYAFFKNKNFFESQIAMETSRKTLKVIEDYPIYFQILSFLKVGDTTRAMVYEKDLRNRFPESPLLMLLDSVQVEIALNQNKPDTALKYLLKMVDYNRFDQANIYLRLIKLFTTLKKIKEFKRYSYKFLQKYPFHNTAERVYLNLKSSYPGRIPQSDLKKLIDYLFTTNQFLAVKNLIDSQRRFAKNRDEKEYFEWLLVETAYHQGEYRKVLNWCLKNRGRFKTLRILREIDLYTARCYLHLGQVKNSIVAYLKFQRRYPEDSLSPEVLWKVAWLYEELKDISSAIRTYRILNIKYPENEFKNEALFRIGLDYYRLNQFKTARTSWKLALKKIDNQLLQQRIRYWIGKSFEKEKNFLEQSKIYIDLASRPVDSYYSMKAFLLTSNGSHLHHKINEIFWQLHHYEKSYLSEYVSRYQRALLVHEILGKKWANQEIKLVQVNIENWPEMFAKGEFYERIGNYGQAYRKFRSIFENHFFDANLSDMVVIFKKLYPFYYSNLIDSVSRRFSISPELILSVIKKESAFEPQIISYANAYGLMQLLPNVASQLAPRLKLRFTSAMQLFDPEFNITIGSFYLSSLLKKYRGNLIMALGAYNAGPHRMDRWIKIFPTNDDDLFMENLEFEQTRVYVRTCLKYYWIYKLIVNPEKIPEEILTYPVNFRDFY